ncbi:hypothetical protein [Paenibacillus sp. 203]|uniref:hypothetical protein n=1 Tax=Paenibacillus sp. 203 TaxID=3096765 RepID=UPI0030093DDF
MSEVIKRDQYGYKIYPLLDGSEVLWAEEERVLFHRASPESMPLTTDADGVFEDLLALVDSLQQQLAERDRTIAKLHEVLTFYWKPEKYLADEFYEDGHPKSCVITRDRGKKAEEVLKPYEM